MSPRLAAGRVDYNLAMDPELLNAGKIVAASEDRSLATLLRTLLREHIDKRGEAGALHIYDTAQAIPHGTRIARFGETQTLSVQLTGELFEEARAQALSEERPLASLARRSIERYLEACRATAAPALEPEDADDVEDVPRNQYGEPTAF